MLDESMAARKVAEVRDRVGRIRTLIPSTRAEFEGSRDRQDLCAFNLILAIQAMVDLAALVISEAGWGVPGTLGETFGLLADKGVIPAALAERLGKAAKMRNLLVHRYGDVDQGLVYEVVSTRLGDLLDGADGVVAYLRGPGPSTRS